MQRKSLSSTMNSSDLEHYADIIKSGRYFRKISKSLLKGMLRHGEFVSLDAEEYLIRKEHTNPPELIVLLEGSLAVTSQGNFIMRMNNPGDVVGEMSVISGESNHFADVVTEEKSKVMIFPHHLFKVADEDTKVSVAYLIFSHILAEKLKHITAQSLLKKNARSRESVRPLICILDADEKSRESFKSALEKIWTKAIINEIDSYHEFIENPHENRFDLLIADPENITSGTSKKESIQHFIEICNSYTAPLLVISKFCKKEENRIFFSELGVYDFLNKPFADFDLQHVLTKFRKDHYRQKELEQVVINADTDKLTGLANRRRMDEFLDALVTLFPEEKRPFSLIIADVDHFKHYNDTHGHQMGDVVLATVASIFKNRIRRGDLAARFGGEEFVVILPNCAKDNAIKIGNKLRLAIVDEIIPFQEQQPMGNLTCTFGVATFPDDANSKELLLKKADECLYDGKESGRNKVVAAETI